MGWQDAPVIGQKKAQPAWASAPVIKSPKAAKPVQNRPVRGFGDAVVNTLAGVAQGITAIPDAATNAVGAVLGEGARMLGFEDAARNFYNPITLGGIVESAAPTPSDAVGKGVRIASQLTGGAVNIPGVTALPARMMPKVPVRPKAPTKGQQVAEAADRFSTATGKPLRVLASDIGGQKVKTATEWARKTPFGEQINKAADEATQAAAAGRDALASRIGRIRNTEAAGETARAGAGKYIERTSRAGSKLYDDAERLAGDARVIPTKAMAELDNSIRELAETPGGADGIAELTKLRDALAKGDVSIGGIRRMRSVLGQKYLDDGLRVNDLQRRVNRVIDAAGDDVSDSLVTSGRADAASAYKAADKFWKGRIETIDKVLKPIVGKDGEKAGEDVVKGLERAASGNGRLLQNFLAALPKNEANSVRASLLHRMGRAKPSVQNDADDVFSLGTFLTQWNTMTPRGKVALFDKQTRAALDDLAKVSSGARDTQRFANTSNTGTNLNSAVGYGSAGGALVALASGDFMTAGVAALPAAGQYVTAKMMASPGFAQWLARGARIGKAGAPRSATQAHIKALRALATQNPAIRDDVVKLQGFLNDNVGVTAVAAGDAKEDKRK